jgi:hypothetical protein
VSEQPIGNSYRGLALFRFLCATRAAVKDALVKINVSTANRWPRRCIADRPMTGTGIETDKNETGDVPTDPAPGFLVSHDLPGSPRGPQNLGHLPASERALARRGLLRQNN